VVLTVGWRPVLKLRRKKGACSGPAGSTESPNPLNKGLVEDIDAARFAVPADQAA
jgi:hypothetical protein